MKKLSRAIDRFCLLHPNFGIANLMRYIVIGNVVLFLLDMFSTQPGFLYTFAFSLNGLLNGEVWRLVTFLFVPEDGNPFWFLLACYFYYMIGSTLERQWGTAKFTVYYLSGAVLTLLGAILAALITGTDCMVMGATYINLAMFFAFAALYPDAQVLMFFFIPVRIKWLALIDGVFFVWGIATALLVGSWGNAVLPVVALLNFAVFFAPELSGFARREQARSKQATHFHNAVRQPQREQRAQGYRHKCAVCGRTDASDPQLQFRYCSKCAGYHCFCEEHIFNHVHFTDEL